MNKDCTIGVDIGGSHITAGLVNMQTGHVDAFSVVRRHVDRHAPASEIIAVWAKAILEAAALAGRKAVNVGVAMPGPFDYEKGISWIKGFDKYEALYGLNVKSLLAAQLGIEKENIKLRNDAEAFLEGEMFSGATKHFSRVVGITLGTGLGSASCVNGVIVEANLNVAPFKDSTAEEYISTRWFLKRYEVLSGEKIVNTKYLADSAESDKYAVLIFKEFGQNLAAVLRPIIEKENPEAIVLGGNIANAWELFMPEVNRRLADILKECVIVQSQLGENAAMIGAACCFINTGALAEKADLGK